MYPNWLSQRAKLTPNRIGLSFGEMEWTFQQLFEEAKMKAVSLKENGLSKGDRIAILSSSHPDLIFTIYGCFLLSIEMVFLNERLTEDELQFQLKDSDPTYVLVDQNNQNRLSVQNCLLIDNLHPPKKWGRVDFEPMEEDQTISIMYTSGTTGFPKGVRQTAKNHVTSALSSVLNIGLTERDVWLCSMPIFHISGFSILVRSLLYGMEVRLYSKFDLVPIVDDLISGRVTHMSVVSVTLERILSKLEQLQQPVHERFHSMLAGGGPIPATYLERAQQLHIPVLQTYGMTETSSQTATLSSKDSLGKLGSSGKPLFFSEISIEGNETPFAEGEIWVRGEHVTPGYVGHAANQSAKMGGWLHTGDIGYLDDEGFLFVMDRRSDLIISGGENVYPAEVEQALLSIEGIQEAGVVGESSDQWGHVPVAFIVCDEELSTEWIEQKLEEKLAKYKRPKRYIRVDKLPRNASNKLMRKELRAWLIESKK